MFNQDILKKITVLYVEDEDTIRVSTENIFSKLFKDVSVAETGRQGLEIFNESRKNGIIFDIIISDIHMPEMNGLEMLEKIKEIEPDIPCILTTAYTETKYFLKAIHLGVNHYATKPLIMKELIFQIQDICKGMYQDLIIRNQQRENEQYIGIIDQVAIVSKTDLHGNITFANDIFCQVSGYSSEELMGSNQRIVRHPDMAKYIFDTLWSTLRSGKIWRGKLKNKAKDGSAYHINAHIFPIFDETGENITEYMGVNFLTTEEEAEKREFKKKVIVNIKEQKQKETDLTLKIKELENKLRFSSSDNMSILQDALAQEKIKSSKAKGQISHYERELKYAKEKIEETRRDAIKKVGDLIAENKHNKDISHKYKDKALTLQNDVKDKKKEIRRQEELVEEQAKIIKNLKDVIEHREEQLGTK